MKYFINTLKKIDYKLYFTLFFFGLLPTVYNTIRINFIGYLDIDLGFNIASQLAWLNIMYEVIQESVLLPIYFLLGKSISNIDILKNKIKSGLIISFLIFIPITILFLKFSEEILTIMDQKMDLISSSSKYIRLESISSTLNFLFQYLTIVLIVIKKEGQLFKILLVQMSLTILTDLCLISPYPFSLNQGIMGLAYGNLLINSVLLIFTLLLLKSSGYFNFSIRKLSFNWMKDWVAVGGYTGLESFVRNFVYLFMVLKLVNYIEEPGVFWVANNFIWGWLLLPILQLGNLIKRNCGEFSYADIKIRLKSYFNLTLIIVVIWIISLPFWKPFLKVIMNIDDYNKVFWIAYISLPFYILFAFNNIIDSIFYGIGKTNYILFQSLIINIFFYGTLFILFKNGIYKPSLNLISLMFAIGIGLDSILSFFIFLWMLKKEKLKLIY